MSTASIVIFVAVALVLIGGSFALVMYLQHRSKANADAAKALEPDPIDVALALDLLCRFYGLPREKLPRIMWVTGAKLNCHDGDGWLDANGQCVAGNSWRDSYTSAVAYRPGMKLAESALPHELGHVLLWTQGKDDPNHESQIFAPGGLVDQGRNLLRTKAL